MEIKNSPFVSYTQLERHKTTLDDASQNVSELATEAIKHPQSKDNISDNASVQNSINEIRSSTQNNQTSSTVTDPSKSIGRLIDVTV